MDQRSERLSRSLRTCLLGAFAGAAFVTLGLLAGQAPASAAENSPLPDAAESSVAFVVAEVTGSVDETTDAVGRAVKTVERVVAPAQAAAPAPSPAADVPPVQPAAPAPPAPPAPVSPVSVPDPAALTEPVTPVIRLAEKTVDTVLPAVRDAAHPVTEPVVDVVDHVVDAGAQQVANLPLPLGLNEAVPPVDPGAALDLIEDVVNGPRPDPLPVALPIGRAEPAINDSAERAADARSTDTAGFARSPATVPSARTPAADAGDAVAAGPLVGDAPVVAATASVGEPAWPAPAGGPPFDGSPPDALPASGTAAAPGSGTGAASSALLSGVGFPGPGYGRALLSLAATSWCGGVDLEPGSTPD